MGDTTLSVAQANAQMTAPGQPFEMAEADVFGQQMRVWKNAPATLRSLFDLSLNFGPNDFLVYEDERITFDRHYRMASTLAQRFIERGIGKGDRLVIAARNLPRWVVAFWGTVVTGAIVGIVT